MKKHLLATVAILLIAAVTASAVVFTTDTTISPLNTNYDGADVVISNCVVTIDGPHNFASLRVAGNGSLTHTFDPAGLLAFYASSTNEPVVLNSTSAATLANSNLVVASVVVSDSTGTTVFTNNVDYLIGTTLDGHGTIQRTDASSIPDGATVLVSYTYLVEMVNAGLNLAVAGNTEIEPRATINVNGRGYSVGPGPGASNGTVSTGSGAGHGGYGGLGATNGPTGQAYGSTMQPFELGSGGGGGYGGAGGIGGGLVRMVVGGNFLVNGTILANGANGTNSRSGGGSGGSIWLTAQTFAGAGAIHADGGAGEPILGGGGGGGRIAVDFATNGFTGQISAFGGAGWQRGGAGTILLRRGGSAGSVTLDNGGAMGATTALGVTNAPDLTIKGSAIALLNGIQTVGNLVVRSNSSIQLGAIGSATFTLTVLSNATIDAGANIPMDGRGYVQNAGPGAGSLNSSANAGGGGGHAGFGGAGIVPGGSPAAGGTAYDSTEGPQSAGSGGRGVSSFTGGTGGGVIRLTVAGNLQLNGRISADATAGAGNATGGGAGGSIFLTLGGLSGAGTISANGGSGGLPYGGGGGGGRIAITWTSNNFSGSMLAHGGPGAVAGGAGTVYTRPGPLSARLVADNGGIVGTNTDFNLSGINDALVTGGASVTSTVASVTVSNLVVGSNGVFLVGQSFTLNTTFLTINSGGAISADGASSSTIGGGSVGQGSGASGSGGGGHGGFGGRGATGAGGTSGFDSASNPTAPGGRGGFLGNGPAPNGGGYLRIMATSLQVDGRISVNGSATFTNNSGGGSGGSIWITSTTIAGTGGLFADGGSGHLPFGGGGAGGRIAVYYTTNSFTGTMSAKGGPGYAAGGAGTLYLRPAGNAVPRLIMDNGGLVGTNTVIDSQFFGDLRIMGGSMATSSATSISLTGLMIGTNSVLLLGGPNSVNLTISSNADISGRVSLDGTGNNSSYGFGQGSGGGGHGGFGGSGSGANSAGGAAFDSTTSPILPGGRASQISGPIGYGGGALRITLNGSLNLNGKISASGAAGILTNNTAWGGGAGGSIYLTLGGLSGNGSLVADGGSGAISGSLPVGGGGGGGRIAVYYTTNTFTGAFSARGGSGYVAGGAGTIYLKRQDRPGDLIVDNAGNRGTNSFIDGSAGNLGNLSITGGSSLTMLESLLTVSNLTVGANSAFLFSQSATLNISGNLTVASLGAISSDGTGNGPGTGAGVSSSSGGGGHGGYGGPGIAVSGGIAGDLPSAPTNPGGRGGNSGGLGGGALKFNVTKVLQLDGVISANGANATNAITGGGGAGGSVWITTAGLAGSGLITANGGAGRSAGDGGGGGGRIAISWFSNSFTGQYVARGGPGFIYGGAGSVYLNAFPGRIAQVFVDNGGIRGANTGLLGIDLYDLTVQGGGVALASGGPAAPRLHSLLVRSNGWVNAGAPLSITADATVEAGGGIFVEATGNDPSGAGLSSTSQAGGGGYGGYGGLNQLGKGGAYGSVLSPGRSGAAGGSGTTLSSLGALGGGILRLSVNGTLQLDGLVSANGLNGDNNGGGGSGGSLWLTLGSLSGSGSITASGGNGNNLGGGGGGGRIAMYLGTNTFTGSVSACGGSGYEVGGAGTIYVKTNNQTADLLTLDNCGATGAATPLSPGFGFAKNLVVANDAIGQFQGVLPVFSNVTVQTGGQLTARAIGSFDTNLNLVVAGNLVVTTGAVFKVDALGFAQAQGPGAGNSASNKGSGAGYGGYGGNSGSDAAGGGPYGSGTLPVERGSGGGLGGGPSAGGSEGGGALRVLVGGRATIDGVLSANGGNGIQDDSGGGSGGGILLLANKLGGNGSIMANGGDGELYGGGGGAGGRIALYSPAYSFKGDISFDGGTGAFNGNSGSLYMSSVFPGLQVIGQTPAGLVSNTVNQITLNFSSPLDQSTVGTNDIRLYAPSGLISPSNIALSFPGDSTLQIALPWQNQPGNYRLELGPNISDLIGEPMSQVYTGAFTLVIPAITGQIVDTNGNPVPGVVLRQDNGPLTVTSDASGAYVFGIDSGWTGNLIPSSGSLIFVPAFRSYTNVMYSIANQDYVATTSLAATMRSALRGTNFAVNWFGIAGARYQPEYSTNLVDWLPYDGTIVGTNGPAEILIPTDGNPQKFFRLRSSN